MLREALKKAGIPVLAGTLVVGSMVGFAGTQTSAAAPQNPTAVQQQVDEQSPSYKASIFLGQQDQNDNEKADAQSEAQEDAALASKAKITKDGAASAALAAYPAYTVKDTSLGNENGYLVYEVEMTDNSGKSIEVKVDAGNAKVLTADSQDNEVKGESEAEEADSGVDNDDVQEEVEE